MQPPRERELVQMLREARVEVERLQCEQLEQELARRAVAAGLQQLVVCLCARDNDAHHGVCVCVCHASRVQVRARCACFCAYFLLYARCD